ncbi:MAG: carboxypeptidase regulatory-like domain-containing protein [Anaerolineales bacterium]|nr:carboxypeptidase regulatory-like domain-containing protein [Anaerolineales bacterium]
MKYTKLFLLAVFLLTACTVPATETPASIPTLTMQPSTNTPEVDGTPTLTVTPDVSMGTVEGHFTWLLPASSGSAPISEVTVQLDRHSGEYLKYKVRTEADGRFVFANVEPGEYGFGIYMNLQLGERQCDAPEYVFSQDLGWQHYASWLKIDVFYDVLFSSTDISVTPGKTVVLDFVLKCP